MLDATADGNGQAKPVNPAAQKQIEGETRRRGDGENRSNNVHEFLLH
jgi:hypothetical protein